MTARKSIGLGNGTSPLENVLGRLESVRQRQSGQWSARCPAHADKGPSLSVRESPDGSVLLHCFSGCNAIEIVTSIGLELHDLFPPRNRPRGTPKRIPSLLTASQALELLESVANRVAITAANNANNVVLTEKDKDCSLADAGYINYLRSETKRLHHD